jgi:hypothetical protein
MEGQVEGAILQRCLSDVIRRHEIWRTSYDMEDGRMVQVVHAPADIQLPCIDLRGLSSHEQERKVLCVVGEAAREPFDLTQGPLLQAMLVRLTDSEQRLYLIAHLSIVDGVSVYQILPSELCALYSAYSSAQPSPLPDLDLQYGDYAYWQRQFMQGAELKRQIAYWRKQLGYQVPVLNWPHDRIRRPRGMFRGEIRSFDLPGELVETVKALGQSEGVTFFLVLLAALVALLHGYTQQEEIIVGTPSSAGRERAEMQRLLGYFLTPVALRFDLTGHLTFRQLLREAQRLMLEALANDDVPLEVLAEELKLPPDARNNPFFSVAISQQPPMPHLEMEWSITSMDIESGGAPWDLYIAFIDQPNATMARVQYDTDLFESGEIERMMAQYLGLLGALASNVEGHLSGVRLLPDLAVAAAAVTSDVKGHAE